MAGLSIIIPSLNRPLALKRSLSFALKQDTGGGFEYEVIVVLDKRDRESGGWLENEAISNRRLKVFRSAEDGVNSARNLGIKESSGEILYFLDDDCILRKNDQLINLCQSFKSYPDASAIGGGYLTDNNGRDIFRECRNLSDNYYLQANRDCSGYSGALLGGNTAYRKGVFSKYGYFDESMRYGAAETELNDRVLKGGGKLYFVEGLSVLHSTGRQRLSAYLIKSFLQGRGKAYSVAKNGRLPLSPRSRPGRIWFMRIVLALNVNLAYKIIASAFLFINSLCYQLGLFTGRFYRYPGVRAYGK